MSIAAPYTAIVVGGTGSIGRAIATKFASLLSTSTSDTPPHPLFNVCIISRSEERGLQAAASLPRISDQGVNQRHFYVYGDISNAPFWEGLTKVHRPAVGYGTSDRASKVIHSDLIPSPWTRQALLASSAEASLKNEELHPLPNPTVLINAAGLVHRSALPRMSVSDVEAQLSANLDATIWSCKYMYRWMLQTKKELALRQHARYTIKSPSIINVSSLIGTHGGAGAAVYAATKGGIISLTRALSEEYGRSGIRVNAIVPGMIESPMAQDGVDFENLQAIQKAIPLNRFGTADEVADAVAFLASNDYANNCILNLDGGLSATSFATG